MKLKTAIKQILITTISLGWMAYSNTTFAAPDYVREQRWTDEVVPGILVGDAVYLTQQNKHRFLGLYAVTDNVTLGVIVVHGMGVHPDWGMIGAIRQRLFDSGYTTLSIQMPVLGADANADDYPALFPEAAERLHLAVSFLKEKGYQRIAIVSHSAGSRMTRTYMVKNPPEVAAWVALSLTRGDTFAGVKAPVFDVYAENDLPHVLSAVSARKKSLIGNPESRQLMIPGTDHFFNQQEEQMIKRVEVFLTAVAATTKSR